MPCAASRGNASPLVVASAANWSYFGQVINLVRRHAPGAAIAFNSTPADTFDAAARWVDIPGPTTAR